MSGQVGRVPDGTGLSSPTEPCSTVSALTGFDPSRKEQLFDLQLDIKRRVAAMDNGLDAAKALKWLHDYGRQSLNGSDYAKDFIGSEEARGYLKEAQTVFAEKMLQHAISHAEADVEQAYRLAIKVAEKSA